MNKFEDETLERIREIGTNQPLLAAANAFMDESISAKYSYNFSWQGRPIIQYPQDMVAVQELIWRIKPDLIIETGIAHGGSLILSASLLAMLDYCDAVENQRVLDPRNIHRRVLGIDIDIRSHNRSAIESHPMSHRIDMIQGSSVSPEVIAQVHETASRFGNIMIMLDSNHTHEHVFAELEAYAPLTSPGSYCIVFDTIVEDLPESMFPDRPWSKGNNPKTAVWEYLRRLKQEGRTATDGGALAFEIDSKIEDKLLITVAPDGYLKRI